MWRKNRPVFTRSSSVFVLGSRRDDRRGPAALYRDGGGAGSTSIAKGRAKSGLRSATCWAFICCPGSKASTPKALPAHAGHPEAYPHLQAILTRPIHWDLIRREYDQMIKYATALRLGTADADTILRRFTRSQLQHPTYQAIVELGKAVKTVFLCRYLHAGSPASRDPRRAAGRRELE